MKGDPLETKKIAKKVSQSRKKTCTKKFLVKGGNRTQVFLLGRPQKIKFYAQLILVWQLNEASL